MSNTRVSSHRDERVNVVFLRAIGSMSLAAFELDGLRSTDTADRGAWHHAADQLAEAAAAVMEGASGSSFPGNTISILRQGVRVAVDAEHVDRLTERIHRHVRAGRALGIGEGADLSDLTLTA